MKLWTKFIVIMLFFTLLYALYYAYSSPYRISAERARDLLKKGQIDIVLDVRTQVERDTLGFYPESLHIPAAYLDVIFPYNYPNKEISILVYCNTGQRARKAVEKLHELGYKNAVYIATTYKDLI